jgi:phosphatidylserine/phosphatidylglycerophosphate/cardiolipin synthase-like enzyme
MSHLRNVTAPRIALSGILDSRTTSKQRQTRSVELRLIADESHYPELVQDGILGAKTSIWIATANLKDLHVEAPLGTVARARGKYVSLFERMKREFDRGLDVRVLHAAKPSRVLASGAAWTSATGKMSRCCIRVHLKMIAVDGRMLYLGSANFSGAGLGAKSVGRRNFEAGIVTDDPLLLDQMQERFDLIWTGQHCGQCRLRQRCALPLDQLGERR